MVIWMNIYQRILQSKYNIYYSPGVDCFIFLSITLILTLFILFIGELANYVVLHQNKSTLYKKDCLKLNFGIFLDLIKSSFVNFPYVFKLRFSRSVFNLFILLLMPYKILSWFCHTNRWKLIHVRTKYILWNFEKLHFDVTLLLEISLHFKHRVITILFLISRSNHFYKQLLHLENSDLLISFSNPRVSIILSFLSSQLSLATDNTASRI